MKPARLSCHSFLHQSSVKTGLLLLSMIMATTGVSTAFAAPVGESDLRAARAEDSEGKALYGVYCSSCHGATGKGDGHAAQALSPVPRPFKAALKGKKEAQILEAIAKGEGQMPGWGHVLKPEQIRAIYTYVQELARNRP